MQTTLVHLIFSLTNNNEVKEANILPFSKQITSCIAYAEIDISNELTN